MTHKVYWEQWFEIIYLSILINIQPKNHLFQFVYYFNKSFNLDFLR
jgi:hypothetical protein